MVVQSEESHGVNTEGTNINDRKQKLRQRFEVIKKLGQGTYGKVQLAVNKETRQEVAIKTIRKAKIENEQDLIRIRREIQIMSSIQHPHIIHIYEVFENCEKIVLVMQYASGGELYDYLGCHKKLPEKEARRIFRQVAAAIYYCHKNKICHRDLKLENILLDDKGNAKIADFGLSNVFDERKKLRTFCGSPLYASPEIVKGTPYCGPEVDCWSLGVLLYTLVYGAMPFDGSNFKRLVKQISEGDYYEPKLKSKASGIIRRLLTVDVAARANIKDICNDEWVNQSYDHSLLKVAYDMACLTPVSTSSLPVSSHKTELNFNATKTSLLKNIPLPQNTTIIDQKLESIMKLAQNELTNLHSLTDKKNPKAAVQKYKETNNVVLSTVPGQNLHGSPLTSHGLCSTTRKEFSTNEKNQPNEVRSRNAENNYWDAPEKDIIINGNHELPILSDKSISITSFDEENLKAKYNGSALQNMSETKYVCQEKQPFKAPNHESVAVHETNELLGENEFHSNHKSFGQTNIPNSDKDLKLHRQSTVEQFRAWRANLDKQKKSEPDSILPIFDVTSVIPKRSNETRQSISKERLPNDIESSKTTDINNGISNCYNLSSSQKINCKNDILSSQNKDNGEDASCISHNFPATDSISNAIRLTKRNELTASKERKDVIEFLNQVCTQRKLSSDLKKQFVSALRADSMNNHKTESLTILPERNLISQEQNPALPNSSKCAEDLDAKNISKGNIMTSNMNENCVSSETPKEILQNSISETGFIKEAETEISGEKNSEVDEVIAVSEKEQLLDRAALINNSTVCVSSRENQQEISNSQSERETGENKSKLPTDETQSNQKLEKTTNTETQTSVFNSSLEQKTMTNQDQSDRFQENKTSILKETIVVSSTAVQPSDNCTKNVKSSTNQSFCQEQRPEPKRRSRSHSIRKLKTRSCSVDDDERIGDLEKILRRPRKYSLCALLAASFEFDQVTSNRTRRESDSSKKLPGKVTIPRSFDPSSESEASTPVEKKEIVLIPSISVAENKQKIEKKIEKVKLSALSMKPRRKSEAEARRKLKKYTRSRTDVLQCIGNLSDSLNVLQSNTIMFSEKDGHSYASRRNEYNFTDTDEKCQMQYGNVFLLDQEESITQQDVENMKNCNLGYVPITRCCKKINFPPKCSRGAGNNTVTCRTEYSVMNEYLEMQEQLNEQKKIQDLVSGDTEGMSNLSLKSCRRVQRKIVNGEGMISEKDKEAENTNQASENGDDQAEMYSNETSLQSNDSLNSSSLEKDSSDNDDELDSMIFDSNLEEYESGDLWKFLKTINNDLSYRLKKVRRNPTKSVYARSKSQECKVSEDCCALEKSLIRSRSKEEKQNDQPNGIISHSSEETCDSSSMSDFNQTSSRHSFAHLHDVDSLDNELMSSKTKLCDSLPNELFKDPIKGKYFSLSSLPDSQSFLSENSLQDRCDSKDFESWGNESNRMIPNKSLTNGTSHPGNRFSVYATIRPNQLTKNKRSHSHITLNGDDTCGELFKGRPKTLSHIDLKRSDNEHSSSVRSKALSDLDISYKEATYNAEFCNAVSCMDLKEKNSMRFSKSLGSKLNLEPRSILLDSPNKQHSVSSRNKSKNDVVFRKHGRKVSFINDTKREEHTNFALESIAKAQMALNNVDRDTTDNDISDEKGTLLEALKTQGYKSIISQRLQQNEEMEIEPLNRRYSLGCFMNSKNFNGSELPFNFSNEYAKRIQWNRNLMYSLDNDSNDYNDLEYSDLLNLNGLYDSRIPRKIDTNWCNYPNMWLYQNTENMRPNRSTNERMNWEETDFNLWHKDSKFQGLSSKTGLSDVCDRDISQLKTKRSNEQDKSAILDLEPEQTRNTESPIEKLTMKIKALKNRCQQKSFDESIMSRGMSSESLENHDEYSSNRAKSNETDTSSLSYDLSDTDKSKESVSDRIWRKSFYSRFNDIPTLRRRRSMLFDPECSQDPIVLKALKFRNNKIENKEILPMVSDRELSPVLFKETNAHKTICKFDENHVNSCATNNVSEQNIPNHIQSNGDDNSADNQIQGGE